MQIRVLAMILILAFAAGVRAEEAISIRPDVVYGHKDGMALTFDLFTPTKNAKGIGLMFMVSGGWVSQWAPPEQMQGMFQPMLDQGYTVMAVRHGSSPRYLVPDAVADVKLALQYITDHADELHIDEKKLGVFGFSAGGHLSLTLGTQSNDLQSETTKKAPRIAAVVAVFPPTDLAPYVEIGNPRREQFPALRFEPTDAPKFSPLMHVSSDDAPTLLFHGDEDELVPLWHSEKIDEAFKAANVPSKLVIFEGAAHGFNGEQNKQLVAGLLEWFDKYLK